MRICVAYIFPGNRIRFICSCPVTSFPNLIVLGWLCFHAFFEVLYFFVTLTVRIRQTDHHKPKNYVCVTLASFIMSDRAMSHGNYGRMGRIKSFYSRFNIKCIFISCKSHMTTK